MEIECQFYLKRNNQTELYGCRVLKTSFTSSKPEIVSVIGIHISGRTNNEVIGLDMANQPIAIFPKNLSKVFPGLKFLRIKNCGLEKVSKEDLEGLENLEQLDLSNNKLSSLPDDLFTDMRKLRSIFLENNQLERLSSIICKPIAHRLVFFNLEGNKRINEKYNTGSRIDLKKFLAAIDANCLPEIKAEGSKLHEKIFLKLANFQASGEYSDYTINAFDKEFKIHKNIFAAQSIIFASIFTSNAVLDIKSFSKIEDLSEKVFEGFLNYFYSGKCDEQIDIIEMFKLASVFEVEALTATCIARILEKIDESNAPDVFNLGHEYNVGSLIMHALRIIQKMFPNIPAASLNNRDHINKVIAAKRELDAVVASLSN